MARSGYEAVYQDVMRTPQAAEVMSTLRMWTENAWIDRYEFTVRSDPESGVAVTHTAWKVRFGPLEQDFRDPEYTRFQLNVEALLSREGVAEHLLKETFGKGVGTRNCRLESALKGEWTKHRCRVRPFQDFMTEHVADAMREQLDRKKHALVGSMIRTSESEEFARRRHAALCAEAQQEVRKALLKYRDVPHDVLAQAIRDAMVEGIMLE